MRVVFTAQARAGLREIALCIGRDNKTRAQTFVQELQTKSLQLAFTPHAFPLVPRYENHGIRRRVFRDYLIFYRVDEDRIVIVHVLHGARDYEAIIFSGLSTPQ